MVLHVHVKKNYANGKLLIVLKLITWEALRCLLKIIKQFLKRYVLQRDTLKQQFDLRGQA